MEPQAIEDVLPRGGRRKLAPVEVTMADLMARPSYQEARRKAAEQQRTATGRTGTYTPPNKPLNRYTDAELQAAIDNCAYCGGVQSVMVRNEHDLFGGKSVPCPNCSKYLHEQRARRDLERMRDLIDRYSMLKGQLLDKTFKQDSFDPYCESLEKMHENVYAWAANIYTRNSAAKPWCFLYGPPGTGKTHLAAAAANALTTTHIPVVFTTFPELLGMASANGYARREEVIQVLQNIPVLIVDDLRKEELRWEWAASILFRILDHRYVTRSATMIVSNHPLRNPNPNVVTIEQLETRLASRLGDVRVTVHIAVDAEDYRARERS